MVTLTLHGELDSATAPQLETALRHAIQRARRGIAVDISRLDFIGAAGFHVLEREQHLAQRRHLAFVVLADAWKLRVAKLIPDLRLNIQLAPGQADMLMRAGRALLGYGLR